jgi:hypothetical protein
MGLPLHRTDVWIVAIQNRETRRREAAHHLRLLRPGHIERAERAVVFAPDRGDDRDVRPQHARVSPHLAPVSDTDLDDGVAVRRPNSKDGLGDIAEGVALDSMMRLLA